MKRAIFILIILFSSTSCISNALYGERHKSDEFHFVKNKSGWKLALYRYFPDPKTPKRKHPVLICHGISSNKWMLDLDPKHSIAFYLKKMGFEVWMVNLRGTDIGTKPSIFNRFTYDYTFDDYVREDLPAIIDYVLSKTGADSVDWVGHSMGGMVMYAYTATYGDEKINAFVPVGSPVRFDIPNKIFDFVVDNNHLIEGLKVLPTRPGSLLIAPFGKILTYSLESTIWNRNNLSPLVIKKLLTLAVDNIAGGVLNQFRKMVLSGKFESFDGQINYLENLKNVKIPILFLTAILDNLSPPQNVLPAFERISSNIKKFVVLSTGNGFLADYGHVDMIIGDLAKQDAYPVIAEFLEEND